MLDFARLNAPFRQLPKLFHADAVGLRIRIGVEFEFLDQALAEMAPAAFCQNGNLCVNLDALNVGILGFAVDAHAHVANDHATHAAVFPVTDIGRGEAGEDVHAGIFGVCGQPLAEGAQRHDDVAVIVLLGRGRQAGAPGLFQVPKFIPGDIHADGRRVVPPIRQQFIQRAGFDHRAGENMRTNLGPFFNHRDHEIVSLLLQP